MEFPRGDDGGLPRAERGGYADDDSAYLAERRRLSRELRHSWRAALPPNPTPAQECAAFERDAETLFRARLVAEFRERLEGK